MSVYDYFQKMLGCAPRDESLRELPMDSNCGRDCEKVIASAAIMLEGARVAGTTGAGVRATVLSLVNDTVEVFWRG